jgi:hypothetical protein
MTVNRRAECVSLNRIKEMSKETGQLPSIIGRATVTWPQERTYTRLGPNGIIRKLFFL